MRPEYSIVTPPTREPIAYDEAAEHLRVDSTDDIEVISSLIPVAREMIDGITGLASTLATWRVVSPSWRALRDTLTPSFRLRLFRAPLVDVDHVKYYDTDNVLRTLDPSQYLVIDFTSPGSVILTGDRPLLFNRPDAVQIQFQAGHAEPSNVPPIQRHLVKMLVHHLYEERTPVTFGTAKAEIPWTITALVNSIKVGGWCS